MISAESVKQLREKTGISVVQCKKALEDAGGDFDAALTLLSEASADIAKKKGDRELAAGTVAAYVHATKQMGALVLLNCETDFVSKNQEFADLAYAIAMHAAAMRPENKQALLEQPYIKDPSKTIARLLEEAVQKFGERTDVGGFSVFAV